MVCMQGFCVSTLVPTYCTRLLYIRKSMLSQMKDTSSQPGETEIKLVEEFFLLM